MNPVNRSRWCPRISYAAAIVGLSVALISLALYNPKMAESQSIRGAELTEGESAVEPGLLALDGY